MKKKEGLSSDEELMSKQKGFEQNPPIKNMPDDKNPPAMKFETRYVTTDLHIESPKDLTPLAEVFEEKGLIVYQVMKWDDGLWSSRFRTTMGYVLPEKNIVRMLNAIESLNKNSRTLWESCTIRDFDIAYDCGEKPGQFIQRLSSTTIQRIARVGAAIVLTLYSPINENFTFCNLPPKANAETDTAQ